MATTASVPVEERDRTMAWSWARIVATNACPRCGGLLVKDTYVDLNEDARSPDDTARRCVQCGEVVDPTILGNRSTRLTRVERGERRMFPIQMAPERS